MAQLPLAPTVPPYPNDPRRIGLAQHKHLSVTVANLTNRLRAGDIDQRDLETGLQAAQCHIAGLDAFFSATLSPVYYNEYRQENSTIAQRVLDIPELLEILLEHLDVATIMTVYETRRGILDIIEASSKVQDMLSLQVTSSQDGTIRYPFNECLRGRPGSFKCSASLHGLGLFGSGSVMGQLYIGPQRRLPVVGSRWRSMFICHPPPKQMEVEIDRCSMPVKPRLDFGGPQPVKLGLVYSVEGLTIGGVYDLVEKLVDEDAASLPEATEGEDDGWMVSFYCRFTDLEA